MARRTKHSTPKNLTPSRVGQAFITVLKERGVTLYGPGMHPGVGYGWGYFGDMPEAEHSGYANLVDMVDAFLLSLEENGNRGEEPCPSRPSVSSAGFAMVSQGVEIVAAALHFAPNIPVPQELLAATALESPEDLEDEQKMEAAMDSIMTMVEQGILETTHGGDIIVSSAFQEGVARMLMALDMPLVVGQERAERAFMILVPPLLEVAEEAEAAEEQQLLRAIEPHLLQVTTMAQGRGGINAVILSIILAQYLVWAGKPYQARSTLEQLFAMLDLGILEACTKEEAQFFAHEIFDLGHSGLDRDDQEHEDTEHEDASYLDLARVCFEQALDIRQQCLDPFDPDIAETLVALGEVASEQGNLKAALDYYRRAETIYRQNLATREENIVELFEVQQAIGMTLLGMKDFVQAEAQFCSILSQLSAAPLPDATTVEMLRYDAINGLGMVRYQQGYTKEAIQLLRESTHNFHPTPDDRGGRLVQLKMHSTLSMMLLEQGNGTEAGKLLRQMLLISEQSLGDDRELAEALRTDLERVLSSISEREL